MTGFAYRMIFHQLLDQAIRVDQIDSQWLRAMFDDEMQEAERTEDKEAGDGTTP